MTAVLLIAAWLALAVVLGLALGALTTRNTRRTRSALPVRKPGAALDTEVRAAALDHMRHRLNTRKED